jgi:hypothetical protein
LFDYFPLYLGLHRQSIIGIQKFYFYAIISDVSGVSDTMLSLSGYGIIGVATACVGGSNNGASGIVFWPVSIVLNLGFMLKCVVHHLLV